MNNECNIINDNDTIECIGVMRALYLDYVNNFLTIERFAEYYQMSLELAQLVVKEGKILHELYCKGA